MFENNFIKLFRFQGHSKCSLESSLKVLVMLRSKSVSICNHFHAKVVDSIRHRTF